MFRSLDFRFYVPPQKDRSLAGNKAPKGSSSQGNAKATDIQPRDYWHSDWKSEYNQLPAMIKVIVKIENWKSR